MPCLFESAPKTNILPRYSAQKVHFVCFDADDRTLGRYQVDARNGIMESARIDAELRRLILTRPEVNVETPEDAITGEVDIDENRHVSIDEDDLGLDDEPVSWDDVKEDVIPSYVAGVTFTVTKDDLTPDRQKELEQRFPGVIVETRLSETEPVPVPVMEKPKGVRTAIFEID
jgi:hypothetical protein